MKSQHLSVVAWLSLSLVICPLLAADDAPGPVAGEATALAATSLYMKSGEIPLDPNRSLHKLAARAIPAAGHYVLQLDGPLTSERLGSLANAGITLGQYLPAHAYIVRLPAGFNPSAALGQLEFVRWVGPFQKAWKLDPEIGTHVYETAERVQLMNQGTLKLLVALFEGEDLDAVENAIATLPGVTVIDKAMSGQTGLLEITIPQGTEGQLADLDAVQWVEEAGEATFRNDTNRWILQSFVPNSQSVWAQGINGSGEVGGLIDGGVRTTHCSFNESGKVLAYFGSTAADSHGTHTAGTFLGDERPSNGLGFRGMAYKARLAFTNLGSVTSSNLNSVLTQDHNAGARVHSNSWGNDGTTAYNAWARDIDLFSFNNEDDLVLFAVTNLNSTVKTPENAKNCLAVAACTDNAASSHCSGGTANTNDGRRKPEIMAPGCSTVSSQSSTSCGFFGLTGTSMACPAVAGAGLLVRQYYREGYYPSGAAVPADGFIPSGALIKATLINSAVDVTGIAGFPSTREGWGRVLLENALYFIGDVRRLIVLADRRNAAGMTTGQVATHNFTVSNSSQPLEVTLVWTEKEATLNANPAYINNLNLELVAPGGATYLGNVFSGGASATGGTPDNVNNVEQILINNPPIGRYTVSVRAAAVNTTTPQGFALIATGSVQSSTLPRAREIDAR